jgi:hypothetical protein
MGSDRLPVDSPLVHERTVKEFGLFGTETLIVCVTVAR